MKWTNYKPADANLSNDSATSVLEFSPLELELQQQYFPSKTRNNKLNWSITSEMHIINIMMVFNDDNNKQSAVKEIHK